MGITLWGAHAILLGRARRALTCASMFAGQRVMHKKTVNGKEKGHGIGTVTSMDDGLLHVAFDKGRSGYAAHVRHPSSPAVSSALNVLSSRLVALPAFGLQAMALFSRSLSSLSCPLMHTGNRAPSPLR